MNGIKLGVVISILSAILVGLSVSAADVIRLEPMKDDEIGALDIGEVKLHVFAHWGTGKIVIKPEAKNPERPDSQAVNATSSVEVQVLLRGGKFATVGRPMMYSSPPVTFLRTTMEYTIRDFHRTDVVAVVVSFEGHTSQFPPNLETNFHL